MRASLIAQSVKNLPAVKETQVQFLGWKDPLEKETATHSSILAWRIPWIEEPGGLHSPWGRQSGDLVTKPPQHHHKYALPFCSGVLLGYEGEDGNDVL